MSTLVSGLGYDTLVGTRGDIAPPHDLRDEFGTPLHLGDHVRVGNRLLEITGCSGGWCAAAGAV